MLRQQIVVLKRGLPRPRLKPRDRWSIAAITGILLALLDAVTIVRPETAIRWHRSLWRLFWRHPSQRPVGRPLIDADHIRREFPKGLPPSSDGIVAAHNAQSWCMGD